VAVLGEEERNRQHPETYAHFIGHEMFAYIFLPVHACHEKGFPRIYPGLICIKLFSYFRSHDNLWDSSAGGSAAGGRNFRPGAEGGAPSTGTVFAVIYEA